MRIEPCGPDHLEDHLDAWVPLRHALWPDRSIDELRREARALLDHPGGSGAWLARDDDGAAIGFAEATLRHDYVNGCETSPVAFLEGIYVAPVWRRQGIARRLMATVEAWAAAQGCAEFASDAELANTASHAMHNALGFAETERVVYFRKKLPPTPVSPHGSGRSTTS